MITYLPWILFVSFIFFLLFMDLAVLNRKPHEIGIREALAWTGFWVSLAMLFNVAIYFIYEYHFLDIGIGEGFAESGKQAAMQFLTGYLIEESLSVDNLFVIAVIITYFKVPTHQQHRVLYWGILGALVFRGIMIGVGAVLISRLWWIVYVFGFLLIFTAIKMLRSGEEEVDITKNVFFRFCKKFYPVSSEFDGKNFFTRIDGKRAITPLFMAILVVESSDIMFAIDSIPAIFAITKDPFIVFTSNVFAILGLRSIYFAIAVLIKKLKHLKTAIVIVLGFVGVKMILAHHFHIPTGISLGVVGGILGLGVVVSLLADKYQKNRPIQG